VLVVVNVGLGTLNALALMAEALAARGLRRVSAVIGSWPAAPDLAARCNVVDLPAVVDALLLGAMPRAWASASEMGGSSAPSNSSVDC
jgi:dethiobiotin synthetase